MPSPSSLVQRATGPDQLVISSHTVEHHITHVYQKIGARGRADAAAYALRRGLA